MQKSRFVRGGRGKASSIKEREKGTDREGERGVKKQQRGREKEN